jgi:Zn-dependent protease with chaperone function
MSTSIPYKVEPKENVYFVIALAFSLVVYSMIVVGLIAAVDYGKSEFIALFAFYAILILVLTHLLRGLLVGIIRGNAIKIGPDQFPDIHAVVLKQVQQLQLANVPDVYLLQQGGALNAFATGSWAQISSCCSPTYWKRPISAIRRPLISSLPTSWATSSETICANGWP